MDCWSSSIRIQRRSYHYLCNTLKARAYIKHLPIIQIDCCNQIERIHSTSIFLFGVAPQTLKGHRHFVLSGETAENFLCGQREYIYTNPQANNNQPKCN